MANENPKDIFNKLNSSVLDFSEQMFGKDGRKFLENAQSKVNEFNGSIIKSFVDFTDKVLEKTKLADNDIVKKSSDSVKDLLRQWEILEEDYEDDF